MEDSHTHSLFDGLVKNAIDFFNQAFDEKLIENKPKYSLLSFVSGVELILKARLMHEHWSLILVDPAKADYEKFNKGDFKSINISVAIERINKILNENIRHDYFGEINFIQNHRNKLVHFYEPAYLNKEDSEHRKKVEKVVSEQFRTWYRLSLILKKEWKVIFKSFRENFYILNDELKKNRKFLNEKFKELSTELKELQDNGHFIAKCPVSFCEFDSLIVKDTLKGEAFYAKGECLVCDFKGWVVSFYCKDCQRSIIHANAEDFINCKCGSDINIDDEISVNFKNNFLDINDEHSDENILCSYCESEFIVEIKEKYLCLKCLEEFSYLDHCEACNQYYVIDDYHALEGSWLSGCEMCPGKKFDD
jgi:hypothetical protein